MLEPTIAIIGLILSAFFSGSEIAFIQANPLQLEVWWKQNRRMAKTAHDLLSEPERFLTTVLVGTNIANVLTSSFATITLIHAGLSPTISIIFITITILIFGEIVPKVIFRDHATSLALFVSPLIRLFEIVLHPIVVMMKSYSRLITPSEYSSKTLLTRDDLKILFSNAETGEEIEPEEKEVIENIFELGSRPVQIAMTPRSDITAVGRNTSLEEVVKTLIDTGYSKLPVYGNSMDEIVGIVFLHDFFSSPTSLTDIMKPPLFISSSTPANKALSKLKRQNSSIAIVLDDDDNKLCGLITVEDIIEELFGEFEDVFDDKGKKINKLPDGNLIVDSLVEIEDLNNEFDYHIPQGNYDTIGGFILSKLRRIPQTGESLNFGTFYVRVLSRSPNRLERLHLSKKKKP